MSDRSFYYIFLIVTSLLFDTRTEETGPTWLVRIPQIGKSAGLTMSDGQHHDMTLWYLLLYETWR